MTGRFIRLHIVDTDRTFLSAIQTDDDWIPDEGNRECGFFPMRRPVFEDKMPLRDLLDLSFRFSRSNFRL